MHTLILIAVDMSNLKSLMDKEFFLKKTCLIIEKLKKIIETSGYFGLMRKGK